MKSKKGQDGSGEEITVYEYFAQHKHMPLRDSADFPCINVGKPNKASYFPLEVTYYLRIFTVKMNTRVVFLIPPCLCSFVP